MKATLIARRTVAVALAGFGLFIGYYGVIFCVAVFQQADEPDSGFGIIIGVPLVLVAVACLIPSWFIWGFRKKHEELSNEDTS